MHRYLARFVGCLIIALAVSVLSLVVPQQGKKHISVRTNGQTSDVVAAIEALKRNDIVLKVEDDVLVTNPVASFVTSTLSIAAILWVASSAVKRLELLYAKNESSPQPKPKA